MKSMEWKMLRVFEWYVGIGWAYGLIWYAFYKLNGQKYLNRGKVSMVIIFGFIGSILLSIDIVLLFVRIVSGISLFNWVVIRKIKVPETSGQRHGETVRPDVVH